MPTQLPHRRRNGQKQGAGMRVVISLRKPTSPASTHTLTHQHTRLGWNVQMHRPNVNPGNHIQRKIQRSSAPRSSIDLQQKITVFRSPEVKAESPAAAAADHTQDQYYCRFWWGYLSYWVAHDKEEHFSPRCQSWKQPPAGKSERISGLI